MRFRGGQTIRFTAMNYELAVIGNDEAAFEMLCLAAGSGRRTVAVLPVSRHSSWLVGQSLRRLVSNLLVDRTPERTRMFQKSGTPRLLQALIAKSIVDEVSERVEVLQAVGVDVVMGEASFAADRELQVSLEPKGDQKILTAANIVIGTGVRRTAMHRPLGMVPFHRPESLFLGQVLPPSVCIVGGGHFGAGLAALTSLFGVVTRHVAREDKDSVMLELATAAGVQIGHHPADVGLPNIGTQLSELHAEVVDCRRTVGFTESLNLTAINVEPDENGQLWCASNFETWCSGVFGIGDVVGFSPDSALHASVQAERVMNRIMSTARRPHLMDAFIRSSVSA